MHLLIDNPRFRLFWIAGVFGDVSLIAYWTIHGWLALQVSGSPFWVGATAGVGGVAMFLFAPIGGAMIDRFPKKDLLRIATLLRGLLAVGLTALIFSDTIQLWQVIGYAFLSGMAASVRVPGMKTLVMDIAGRENLLAGSALRMASMTVVGVAIPLAIGPVADRIGLGWAYVVIAAGDTLFAILLSLVDIPAPERSATDAPLSRRSPFLDVWDGLIYTLGNPIVRVALGVILISEVFGWSVEPMLPVIARETLGTWRVRSRNAVRVRQRRRGGGGVRHIVGGRHSQQGPANGGRDDSLRSVPSSVFIVAQLPLVADPIRANRRRHRAVRNRRRHHNPIRRRYPNARTGTQLPSHDVGSIRRIRLLHRRHGHRLRRAARRRHRRGDRNAGGRMARRAKGGAAGWGGRRGWGRSISSPLMGEVPA